MNLGGETLAVLATSHQGTGGSHRDLTNSLVVAEYLSERSFTLSKNHHSD